MRNKHRAAMWRDQEGKCHLCSEPMEKWPYEGRGKKRFPRPRQAVKRHIYSRLADERKENPVTVLAHYECQQRRSRRDILVDHRQHHLIKSYMGIFKDVKP